MRKLVLTITLILCALLIGGSSGARGGGPPDGHIEPLRDDRETFCNTPDGQPTMGVAHVSYGSAQPSARSLPFVAPAAPTSNSFTGFVRCPPGDPDNPDCNNISKWETADQDTGFYRDVIFAATTLITNANDGDQWGMTIVKPNGEEFYFSSVTFTSTGNCFIFPSHQICGATSLKIYWYFNSQCALTGEWLAKAIYLNDVFASRPFGILPQLGWTDEVNARMPPVGQLSFPESPYGGTCHEAGSRDYFPCAENRAFQLPWTIAEIGCTLVSVNAILNYHGVPSTPETLNAWLLKYGYYDRKGNLDLVGPVSFAQSQGKELSLEGIYSRDAKQIDGEICKFGPVFARVLDNTHSVTLTGMNDEHTTFTLLDSMDGVYKNLSDPLFKNRTGASVIYSGKGHTYTDKNTGMTINFHSPVEAFVVDPLGRRQGLDPRTGVSYDEIPDAFYGEFSTIGPEIPDDYESPKMLDLRRPVEGTYTLSVVGTGEGTYDADFRMYDQNLGRSQKELVNVATAPGVVHTYRIEFSKAPGAQLLMTGGFDGGGQRPRDVNKFLSYAQLSATSTALPAGTNSYALLVFFNQNIIPSTFHAQLNGVDITSLFSPSPGGGQTVMLPVQKGRNVLQLSVDGSLPNRVATDTDRLVFDVP